MSSRSQLITSASVLGLSLSVQTGKAWNRGYDYLYRAHKETWRNIARTKSTLLMLEKKPQPGARRALFSKPLCKQTEHIQLKYRLCSHTFHKETWRNTTCTTSLRIHTTDVREETTTRAFLKTCIPCYKPVKAPFRARI